MGRAALVTLIAFAMLAVPLAFFLAVGAPVHHSPVAPHSPAARTLRACGGPHRAACVP
jgi:hypothetical protein